MAIYFKPKYHKKITEGKDAGAWVAIPPPAGSADYETDMFAAGQIEEQEKLRAAGETIFLLQVREEG